MKKLIFSLTIAAATILASCGSISSSDITNAANTAANVATTAANVTNAATGTSTNDATANGKTAGAALKSLYSNYKSTGKVSLSGTNLLTAANLVSACAPLKNYKKGDSNYKNFVAGVLEGAVGVVDQSTVEGVVTQLTGLSSVDTNNIANNATTISNSLTSIFDTLK